MLTESSVWQCRFSLPSFYLTLEHIIYSHPRIVLHLCNLFNLMLKHGYVSDQFGRGIVIPLVKDKNGDVTNSENYRGITVSPFMSKIF